MKTSPMEGQTEHQASRLQATKILGLEGSCLRVEMEEIGAVLVPKEIFSTAVRDSRRLWQEFIESRPKERQNEAVCEPDHENQETKIIQDRFRPRTKHDSGERHKLSCLRRRATQLNYKE